MSRYCIPIAALFIVYVTNPGVLFPQEAEPTAEEQLMLELINRARANPPTEGVRLANHPDSDIQFAYQYFNLDTQTMIEEFATYPPQPPLALNAKLTSAARRHSRDMRDQNFQEHEGTDGSTLGTRITESGYTWQAIAENIYAYTKNVEHGHAGFVADWGVPSLGHRKNTLEYDKDNFFWQDVGIGILRTVSAKLFAKAVYHRFVPVPPGAKPLQTSHVGPMIVTIDFATPFQKTPRVVGVIYDDANENQFYDLDEGLGGISITVLETGDSAATPASGGYAIPIIQPGAYTLEASGGVLQSPIQKTVQISNVNIKVDFILTEATGVLDWSKF
jgi:hypothetical protein